MAFSTSTEKVTWFLSLSLFTMMYCIYGSAYGKPPLHLWNEAKVTMTSDTFDVFKNFTCAYFINFYVCFHLGCWSVIFLLLLLRLLPYTYQKRIT